MLEFALGIRRKIGYWLSGYRFRPSGGFHGPLADKGKVLLVADVTSEKARDAVSGLKTELKRICPKAQLNIAGFYNKEKGVTYNLISDDKVKYFTEDSFSFFFQFKDEDVKSLLTSGYDMAIFFTGQDKELLRIGIGEIDRHVVGRYRFSRHKARFVAVIACPKGQRQSNSGHHEFHICFHIIRCFAY